MGTSFITLKSIRLKFSIFGSRQGYKRDLNRIWFKIFLQCEAAVGLEFAGRPALQLSNKKSAGPFALIFSFSNGIAMPVR